ncbi:hypothetical protein ZHAS_00003432 [Anopheles sinensis]|uniref:Uncharacterized protein n=1 Tax=Anopheles sinensis TaxID=74873 RepID=A0A084VEA7_ANOSI|nr:hypothetical protein ZHAS_00003432 [Anopheles sinensis]
MLEHVQQLLERSSEGSKAAGTRRCSVLQRIAFMPAGPAGAISERRYRQNTPLDIILHHRPPSDSTTRSPSVHPGEDLKLLGQQQLTGFPGGSFFIRLCFRRSQAFCGEPIELEAPWLQGPVNPHAHAKARLLESDPLDGEEIHLTAHLSWPSNPLVHRSPPCHASTRVRLCQSVACCGVTWRDGL